MNIERYILITFFSSDFSDNVMRTFYKLSVTMQDNVILLHDKHHNIIRLINILNITYIRNLQGTCE